jgi:hypothetical protein
MKTRLSVFNLLILALGTILISLAGLNWHIGIAAWLGPVFLLFYTRNSKWKGFVNRRVKLGKPKMSRWRYSQSTTEFLL